MNFLPLRFKPFYTGEGETGIISLYWTGPEEEKGFNSHMIHVQVKLMELYPGKKRGQQCLWATSVTISYIPPSQESLPFRPKQHVRTFCKTWTEQEANKKKQQGWTPTLLEAQAWCEKNLGVEKLFVNFGKASTLEQYSCFID